MASNPFLDSVSARDNYISATTDPEYSSSKDKTSSGNPFLDSINVSTNSRKKTKKQQDEEEKQKKLAELAKKEQSAPKSKNLLDLAGDAVGAVGNFVNDNVIKPTVDFGGKVGNTLAYIPQASAQILSEQNQTPDQKKKGREELAKTLNHSLLSNDVATGKANAGQFASEFTQAGIEGAQYVAPLGKASTLAKAGINAGLGAGQNTLDQLNTTGKVDLGETAKSAAAGAVLGVLPDAAGAAFNKVKTRGVTSKVKASVESSQAAEDAAARKAAGFPEQAQNASQNVTTSPNEVVQKVNPKTGDKQYFRIPTENREAIVKGIDGDGVNGIAGIRDKDGYVTHVTAKSPQEMAELGFSDNGVYDSSQIGQAVKNVATPEGQTPLTPGTGQSRYASKTLKNSEFVGVGDDKLGAEYQQTTNATRADQSLQQLDAEGVDNFSAKVSGRLDAKHVTDQTVFDAQAAAQALEEKGGDANLQKAADIYNKLSTHLSKAGQTVQAASIMARRTPQGLRYYAQKQFEKAGVDFTPELQNELKSLVDQVKKAAPKSDESAIARDNVMYFIGKNIPSSRADKISNFWRAGLLTAPTTPLGAITGNAAQALQRNLVSDPIAVFSDMVMGAFTGKRTKAAADFGSSLKGGIEGAKTIADKQYLKTGRNKFEVQREGKYDTPIQGVNYGKGRLGQATGKYVNGVFKVQAAADLPFRAAAQAKSLSSIANAEAINQGLKGETKANFIKEFKANPPEAALARATKEAERAVFGNDTELGKVATNVANSFGGLGRVFVPFSKVPSAVATKVVTSTPLGVGHELVKQIINMKKGGSFDQRAMAQAIGEGTTAVPILGAGYALAQAGNVTGGFPSTQEARDEWQKEGKQPNSVKIGDKWYSLNYIQPFGTILAMGAGLADAEKSGADAGEMIAESLASGGKSFINQSFLQGISSGLDAVDNPTQFAGQYASNLASSLIPNIIRSGVRAADPLQRQSSGIQDGILSGIPGGRDQLAVKLDNNGNPIQAKASFADQYLNPLKPSNVRDDSTAKFYDNAVAPATKLKARRTSEINDLLGRGSVQAAQRKVNEYNQQVTQILAPYVDENQNSIDEDQLDRIRKLYLDDITVNKKGRPVIGSSPELPK